ERYGNKPLETFPLNRIGAYLQFRILQAIGEPTHFPSPLLKGIHALKKAEEWVPSEVELTGSFPQALVTDETQRWMAGVQSVGRGRVVVFGHMKMARDNPDVVLRTLHWLARR